MTTKQICLLHGPHESPSSQPMNRTPNKPFSFIISSFSFRVSCSELVSKRFLWFDRAFYDLVSLCCYLSLWFVGLPSFPESGSDNSRGLFRYILFKYIFTYPIETKCKLCLRWAGAIITDLVWKNGGITTIHTLSNVA